MSQLETAISIARGLNAEDRQRLVLALGGVVRTESPVERAERSRRIREICGKYADLPTSAESFNQRKHQDLPLER